MMAVVLMEAGSNLGVEILGTERESWRGLYIGDWGGGEQGKALLLGRGLLGGESRGGLGGRAGLGEVRGGWTRWGLGGWE